MKKLINFILAIGVCLTLSGCGKVNLDLEKIENTIDNLTVDKFDNLKASSKIEEDNTYFSNLKDISTSDLESINIKDNIENITFRVTYDNKPAYIIIKPKKNKKEEVKTNLNDYFNKFDSLEQKLETEYEDYLIYIFSNKGEEALQKIKQSNLPIFSTLAKVDGEFLESLIGIKTSDLDEFLVKSSIMTQSNSYYILKPKKDKKEEVKNKMDEYMDNLEIQWKTYAPAQYDLVKHRLKEEYGDYLIYIISSDNELVFNKIKECNK